MTHPIFEFYSKLHQAPRKLNSKIHKVSLLIHCFVSAWTIVSVVGTFNFIYNTSAPLLTIVSRVEIVFWDLLSFVFISRQTHQDRTWIKQCDMLGIQHYRYFRHSGLCYQFSLYLLKHVAMSRSHYLWLRSLNIQDCRGCLPCCQCLQTFAEVIAHQRIML